MVAQTRRRQSVIRPEQPMIPYQRPVGIRKPKKSSKSSSVSAAMKIGLVSYLTEDTDPQQLSDDQRNTLLNETVAHIDAHGTNALQLYMIDVDATSINLDDVRNKLTKVSRLLFLTGIDKQYLPVITRAAVELGMDVGDVNKCVYPDDDDKMADAEESESESESDPEPATQPPIPWTKGTVINAKSRAKTPERPLRINHTGRISYGDFIWRVEGLHELRHARGGSRFVLSTKHNGYTIGASVASGKIRKLDLDGYEANVNVTAALNVASKDDIKAHLLKIRDIRQNDPVIHAIFPVPRDPEKEYVQIPDMLFLTTFNEDGTRFYVPTDVMVKEFGKQKIIDKIEDHVRETGQPYVIMPTKARRRRVATPEPTTMHDDNETAPVAVEDQNKMRTRSSGKITPPLYQWKKVGSGKSVRIQ